MKRILKLSVLYCLICYSPIVYSQIKEKGGNVGIGTSAPTEKLHIEGNLYMNIGEGFRILGDGNFFGKFRDGIVFSMEDRNSKRGITDGGFIFRGYTPTDKVAKDWVVIKSPGNVGIGTLNPDSKLTVKGKIHAQEAQAFAGNSFGSGYGTGWR